MFSKFERMGEKVVKGLRRTNENLNQVSWHLSQDLNSAPPKYKTEA
jgi:hypothetical protein